MTGGPRITAALADLAVRSPRAPVLFVPRSRPAGPGTRRPGASGWNAVPAAFLQNRARAIAAGLHRAGLRRGERAIVLVPPDADFFALVLATLHAGVVPVLVDPGVGRRALTDVLDQAEARAYIGTAKAHAARAALRLAPGAELAILTGGAPRALVRATAAVDAHLDDLAAGGPEPRAGHDVRAVGPGETAAVLFTSGSTGPPKGVEYTHSHFAAQIDALRELYGFGPGDVNVATFPPFALFGPALGMTTVIPRMDATRPADVHPPDIVDAVRAFGATTLFGSPALLDAVTTWAAAHGSDDSPLRGVRLVVTAGAPVARRIVAATAALLDGGRVATPYGATEALPVTSVDDRTLLDGPDRAAGDEVDGLPDYGVCVGLPAPGVRIGIAPLGPLGAVAPPDRRAAAPGDEGEPTPLATADLLGPGEVGEIIVAGAQVTSSYFSRPEATRRAALAWDGEPARRMGDVGWIDRAGRLWVCGRLAHVVPTADGPLPPVAIEVLVDAHPWVRRSALVAVPRPAASTRPDRCGVRGADQPGSAAGVRVGVVVETVADAPADHLVVGEVRSLLAAHPRARAVEGVRVHPRLPVDPRHNAKIDRPALAAWWAAS